MCLHADRQAKDEIHRVVVLNNTHFFGALVMLITLVLIRVRMKRLDATVWD